MYSSVTKRVKQSPIFAAKAFFELVLGRVVLVLCRIVLMSHVVLLFSRVVSC